MSLLSECPTLVPPTYGRVTIRSFDIPTQTEQMRLFVNNVFDMYNSTRREDCHILGIRYFVEFDDCSALHTSMVEPALLSDDDIIFSADGFSYVTDDSPEMRTVSVIVSWNTDYINEFRGKPQ